MKLLQSLTFGLVGSGAMAFLVPRVPSYLPAQHVSRPNVISMSAAVEWKGSTLTDTRLAEEAASIFLEGPFVMTPTSGGVNNVCLKVASTKNPSEEYIMRIYNNGGNSARIVWEHEILKQLNQQKLSFSVSQRNGTPVLIPDISLKEHPF